MSQAHLGAWYLASPPTLTFPIARGYRYQLLPLNPNASFAALRDECVQVLHAQEATAARLKGNAKYWFARVYYFVTLHELENIDRGVYQYPHMKMQEVIHFNTTYATNLAAWESSRRAEPDWQTAFSAAESSDSWASASLSIKNALLPAMEAHIRFDLPRAIAAVYNLHYAGLPGASPDEFRRDFFAMASVFDRANEDLSAEIDDAGTNWNPLNWQPFADLAFPFIFSVGLEREMAWEKARLIISSGGSSTATERRLHTYLRAAHPNLDPFEVDDRIIRGYDWQHQPGSRSDVQPGPANLPAPAPPTIPSRLYFQLNQPDGDMELADAVRRDQDLRPLLQLAHWLRQVSGAVIVFNGHASSEGPEHVNANLARARGDLVEYFLFRAGADLSHNTILQLPEGARGASATPEWRFVGITILWLGHAKQTAWGTASRLPSEVP